MEKIILFFGLPGSGKGTQSKILRDEYIKNGKNCELIETGALVREFVNNKESNSVKELKKQTESGMLLPSAVPIYLLVKNILEKEDNDILIIDGVGRMLKEMVMFDEFITIFNCEVIAILLNINEDVVMERLLKRGRVDDSKDVIKDRIAFFRDSDKLTQASINYIKESGNIKLVNIDGEGRVEEVGERIKKELV